MAIRTLSALVAACHDASCRPPTSGGTGGSRKMSGASAPRGGKALKLNETHAAKATPRFNETEFTKKIRAAIEAEPALKGRRTLAQHEQALAKLKAEQLDHQEGQILRKLQSPSTVSNNSHADITVEAMSRSGGRLQRDIQTELTSELISRIKRGDLQRFVSSPNAKPYDETDAILKDFVEKRRSEPLHKEARLLVDHPTDKDIRIQISMRGVGLDRDISPTLHDPAVTPEFEQASTRIGKLMHEEAQARFRKLVDEEEKASTERIQQVADFLGVPANKMSGFRDADGYTHIRSTSPEYTITKEQELAAGELMGKLGVRNLNHDMHMGAAETKIRQQVFDDVLSEARAAGGLINGTPGERPNKNHSLSSNAQVLIASSKYPTDWINASNAAGTVNFKQVKGRAHYVEDGGDGEITMNGSPTTVVHELGHRMEYTVPGLVQLEGHFYDRRTAGESLMPLNRLQVGQGYRSDEMVRPDEFFNVYAGKDYGRKDAYEVFTMGMEVVARNEQGINARKDIDPDHTAMIWGALAVLLPGGDQ